MDFNRTCEKNVENVVVSENTKDIIKCKAMISDLIGNVQSAIKNIYGDEQMDTICKDFRDAILKADDAITDLIVDAIRSNVYDSFFKSI